MLNLLFLICKLRILSKSHHNIKLLLIKLENSILSNAYQVRLNWGGVVQTPQSTTSGYVARLFLTIDCIESIVPFPGGNPINEI
jgi:hypothetical protein